MLFIVNITAQNKKRLLPKKESNLEILFEMNY